MTVYNLGSINIDYFYRVPHLPGPGETLAASEHWTGLGGKGANQSVAIARAGCRVEHIGAIGPDGRWTLERLTGYGVETGAVREVDGATGHAIINIDDTGENAIVIYPGANQKQSLTHLKRALSAASRGDALVLQNETSLQAEAAKIAKVQGMFVVYSAAPFDAAAVRAILPHVDLLVMNQIEADQLSKNLGLALANMPVPHILITRGADGSVWHDQARGRDLVVAAFPVDPVDTTGAGDCFIGYTIAGMDQGLCAEDAMRLGSAASALKVTRAGTADAIPTRAETDAFLAERGTE